jgi:phospholipid/cholesterol/gamma-HCH transport system permease protein
VSAAGGTQVRLATESLPGPLTADTARTVRDRLARHPRGTTVVLDCARVVALDALGAARLLTLVEDGRLNGLDVRLTNLAAGPRRTLATDPAVLAPPPAPRRHPLELLGAAALDALAGMMAMAGLLRETLLGLASPFGRGGIKWDRVLQQMALTGSSAVPIVIFISLLIGVVLALNGAQQLRQFGAAIFIANLVAISMTREMGPLVTAIIVSGRTGSSIAAEIGSMVISEEIDAMRAMALSPVRFLVVPKMVALVAMLPLLTVVSNVAGIVGGYAIGVVSLDLGSSAYLSQTVQSLIVSDVLTGLVKSVVFAVLIGLVGAHRGFTVRGGPEAVGRATTSAVVSAIILCIVANAGFTALFYFAG